MEQKQEVQIDHFGIFSKVPGFEEAFFKLGFVAAGGADHVVKDKEGNLPSCLHFVMDNGYMECMLTYPDDFVRCNNSEAGLVYFEFAMKDAQKSCENVREKGFSCPDVVRASRYADHGKKKGDAIFECIALDGDLLPNIMIGGVDHKTRDLFYHNERYEHENGVCRIEEICLGIENADASEKMCRDVENFQKEIGEFPETECIRNLSLLDRSSMEARFKVKLPADLLNVAAVIMKTAAFDKVVQMAEHSGYSYHVEGNRCIVDLIQMMNIVFVFES